MDASIYFYSSDRDAVLLVTPSDHFIRQKQDFHKEIPFGILLFKSGRLVTFGIRQTHPKTGYGFGVLWVGSTAHVIVKFYEFRLI